MFFWSGYATVRIVYFYIFMSLKSKLIIIGFIVMLGVGGFVGYRLALPQKKTAEVTSQSIMQALQREGFLITETYVVTQQITIDRSTGSAFKDFFWGQDITAIGTMKSSWGVDLRKISAEDISLEKTAVTITLPPLENHGVELVGDIALQNKQGILKKVFNNDNGYNAAYAQLKEAALSAAQTEAVQNESKDNAIREIERLVRLMLGDRDVHVQF